MGVVSGKGEELAAAGQVLQGELRRERGKNARPGPLEESSTIELAV